ncbi:MAG: hypothetical protein AB2L12_01250 [Smithellaceae bacterium]
MQLYALLCGGGRGMALDNSPAFNGKRSLHDRREVAKGILANPSKEMTCGKFFTIIE